MGHEHRDTSTIHNNGSLLVFVSEPIVDLDGGRDTREVGRTQGFEEEISIRYQQKARKRE